MTTTEAARASPLRPGDRVAIIAGNGRLPEDIAESLVAHGHRPFVVQTMGEVKPDSTLHRYDGETLAVEEFPRLLPVLRSRGVTHVVMAGGITRRPDLRAVRPSLALLKLLPRALAALARGDDGLLRMLIGTLADAGIRVVGAHEIMPDLLATEGLLAGPTPLSSDRRDVDAALAAARAIGALDIGQGAVAIGGRVVALEGVEGTDGLLDRARALRGHGLLAGKTRGVLVKCAKKGQELRVDLPSIGPATVRHAHAAGLAGVGVEADRSLVLDAAEVLREAERLGVFVIGLPRGAAT